MKYLYCLALLGVLTTLLGCRSEQEFINNASTDSISVEKLNHIDKFDIPPVVYKVEDKNNGNYFYVVESYFKNSVTVTNVVEGRKND